MSAARVTPVDQAPAYQPPLHNNVEARRLQGLEAGPTEAFWTGWSDYAPGGAAAESPVLQEAVYVVVDGELTVTVGGTSHVLRRGDSVHLPKGTVRSVENRSNAQASLLVTFAIPRTSEGPA